MKILLVEDNQAHCEMLTLLLREENYEIVTADRSAIALDLLEVSPQPDLVIMDIHLRGNVNGITLTEIIKNKHPDIPVIILTGYGSDEILKKSFKAGAVDYILKPVREVELIARVKNICKIQRLERFLKASLLECDRKNIILSGAESVAHLGSWEHNIATRETTWSDEEFRIYGLVPAKKSPSYDILLKKHIHPDDAESVNNTFQEAVDKGIIFEMIHRIIRPDGGIRVLSNTARPFYDDNGKLIKYIGATLDVTDRLDIEEKLRESEKRLKKTLQEIINVLSHTVEMRDPYTAGHSRRVTILACRIAEDMGLDKEKIRGLQIAGLLHDIGKIAIPTEILSKPGSLTAPEYDIIKTHPKVGYDALKLIEFPWPVARIVLEHHEKIDGSGYPDSKKGSDLLLESRILTVADTVEAMAFERPYRKALGFDKAIEEITSKQGVIYDKDVVTACCRLYKQNSFRFML